MRQSLVPPSFCRVGDDDDRDEELTFCSLGRVVVVGVIVVEGGNFGEDPTVPRPDRVSADRQRYISTSSFLRSLVFVFIIVIIITEYDSSFLFDQRPPRTPP